MSTLNDIAYYVNDKVSSYDISLEEYVTTDCILQNKKGRQIAQNLPPTSCSLTRYQEGDILLANIRPYLQKVWFADMKGGASSDILVFRAKPDIPNSFLYATIMQDSFFAHAMAGAKGSKMPRGDKDQILRYIIPTLSHETQDNIGNILMSINCKISVNEQINHNLPSLDYLSKVAIDRHAA